MQSWFDSLQVNCLVFKNFLKCSKIGFPLKFFDYVAVCHLETFQQTPTLPAHKNIIDCEIIASDLSPVIDPPTDKPWSSYMYFKFLI